MALQHHLTKSVPPTAPGVSQHVSCRLMPPVDAAAQLKGLADADGAAAAYAKVRGAVNEGMASLLRDREQDPLRPLQARLRRAVLDNAPAFDLLQGVLPRGPF